MRFRSGPYRRGIEEARFLLARDGADRLHDPDFYREYFQRLFCDADLDEPGIQALRRALDYRQVARACRLIDEDTVTVVIPYGDAGRYLTAWQEDPTLELAAIAAVPRGPVPT